MEDDYDAALGPLHPQVRTLWVVVPMVWRWPDRPLSG